MEYIEDGFLSIQQPHLRDFIHSKVVIQPIPFEKTSSYIVGSSKGPDAIIEASHYVEFFDEELEVETYKKCGICTLQPLENHVENGHAFLSAVETQTRKLLDEHKFVITLGGEHTVTFPVYKAFHTTFQHLSILQIDAHADMRKEYQSNPFSHACVMRRIFELGTNIVQVGIRALSLEEKQFMDKNNIHTLYDKQLKDSADWIHSVLENLTDNVYITIDTDGFCPSIMPGTGTVEPGGIGWNEGIKLLQQVFLKKNVVGFDIVECCPIKGQMLTQYNLAKLLYKLIGYKYIEK